MHPGGMPESSRWLRSEATTPPEIVPHPPLDPEGIAEHFESRHDPRSSPLASLQDAKHDDDLTGGVVAPLLNHRLLSANPTGSEDSPDDIKTA